MQSILSLEGVRRWGSDITLSTLLKEASGVHWSSGAYSSDFQLLEGIWSWANVTMYKFPYLPFLPAFQLLNAAFHIPLKIVCKYIQNKLLLIIFAFF